MARQARIISESGIYHVILRGVNRIRVFLEEEDFVYFLDRLKSQTELQMTATPDVVGETSLLDYDADDEHAELSLDELQSLMEEIAGCHRAEDFKRLPKAVQCECVGRMIDEGGLYKDLSLLTGIPKLLSSEWRPNGRKRIALSIR